MRLRGCAWVAVGLLIVHQSAMAEESPGGVTTGDVSRLEASGIQAVEPMAETLARRDRELSEAKAEIARLHEQVKAMESANRREKIALHYNLGCVFKAAQHFERAESEFLKVLTLDPDDPAVHYNLGILYEDDLKKPSKARVHYARFLELSPDDRDAPKVREWMSRLKP